MKEFEKWLRTQPAVEDGSNTIPSTKRLISEEIWMKRAWKAALEWAKEQLRTDTNGYFNICKELRELNGNT